ncbi:LSM domain-containing protein [Stagonosporopsis vannaccii]|nr:LSM domain-containing protein [Stagonosporopsis vannaccii]
MSFPNQLHGGPAGAPPNMAQNFNAMLQRSVDSPQPDNAVEAQGQPPSGPGYGGVYSTSGPPPSGPPVLGGGRPSGPQVILPVDLPPQAFLTSAMLLDMVDKKVDVLLRDEKEYIGILRSYDQFANLVLTECYERIAARNPDFGTSPTEPAWLIHDVKLPGLMTIRGENVTICATVDLDREDTPRGVKFAPVEHVRTLAAQQKADKKAADSRKAKALRQAGIEPGFGMAA